MERFPSICFPTLDPRFWALKIRFLAATASKRESFAPFFNAWTLEQTETRENLAKRGHKPTEDTSHSDYEAYEQTPMKFQSDAMYLQKAA